MTILYQDFCICKINLLTIADIGARRYKIFLYELWIAIFVTDNIFSIIGSQYRIVAVDHVEEVTSLQLHSSCELQSIARESDDAHSSEGSWTTDTPELSYFFSRHYIDEHIWKWWEIISLWYSELLLKYSFINESERDVCGDGIDEKSFHGVWFSVQSILLWIKVSKFLLFLFHFWICICSFSEIRKTRLSSQTVPNFFVNLANRF